jgi:hypothetical protein
MSSVNDAVAAVPRCATRARTSSLSSVTRAARVAAVLPIQQGPSPPGPVSTCGSHRVQASRSSSVAVTTTRRRSAGLRRIASCSSSQRVSSSAGPGGPTTPRTPVARRSTVTGTSRSIGSSKPGHGSPRSSTVAGRSAVPTRRTSPSGESVLRGHNPRRTPAAITVRVSLSGACARRSRSSSATWAAMRSCAACLRSAKARSLARAWRRSRAYETNAVTGPSNANSNSAGWRRTRAMTTPSTTGTSPETSVVASPRGGAAGCGTTISAGVTAGAPANARSKSSRASALRTNGGAPGSTGNQRNRPSPISRTCSPASTVGPAAWTPPTQVPFVEPRSAAVNVPSAPTESSAWRREASGSRRETATDGLRPATCRPGSSHTYRPRSGPSTASSRPAAPSGRTPGSGPGSPTVMTQPGSTGLPARVDRGSSRAGPTKQNRPATGTGNAASSEPTLLSGAAVTSTSCSRRVDGSWTVRRRIIDAGPTPAAYVGGPRSAPAGPSSGPRPAGPG